MELQMTDFENAAFISLLWAGAVEYGFGGLEFTEFTEGLGRYCRIGGANRFAVLSLRALS